MRLKNIYTKREFVNEILGGTSGGVGSNDGFANNAKLKDTVLGKLINGMFKGITWLWNKSKENYIINRLIARLTNEILRGVILYCFSKNMDLQTGKLREEENIEVGDDKEGDSKEGDENVEVGDEKVEVGDDVQGTQVQGDVEQEVTEKPKELNFEKIYTKYDGLRKFDPNNPDKEILKASNIPDNIDTVKKEDLEEYGKMEKELFDFLEVNVPNYDEMTEEQQQKINSIFVNYMVIKNIYDKSKKLTESHNLNEDTLVRNIKNKISTTGTVKPKLSSPEAGKVSLGKSLAIKGGASANVGDILTDKDKQKYKKFSEDFKVDINSINLAEIELYVESKNEQRKVSSFVNPENLKMIQYTAQELFQSSKTDKEFSSDKSKLQLRWNKELTRIYASFTNLMSISDIDIRGEYRNDIKPSYNIASNLKYEKAAIELNDKFKSDKLIETTQTTFHELNGDHSWLSFTCLNNNFMASIMQVSRINYDNENKLYLLKVTNTFDSKGNINFTNFKTIFSKNTDNNIYFLFINPAYNKKGAYRNNQVLILNEDKNNNLFLFEAKTGEYDMHITDLIDWWEKDVVFNNRTDLKKYFVPNGVTINSFYKFTSLSKENLKKYNLDGVDYGLRHNVPDFYTTKVKEIFNNIVRLNLYKKLHK
jgi:hypothetical protein